MRSLRRLGPMLLLLPLLGAAGAVLAQQQATEDELKAAFLYNFASYVQWPESAFPDSREPLVFGILGSEVLADDLDRMVAGRSIDGRPIDVRRVRAVDELEPLHVLFVDDAVADEAGGILSAALAGGVLTVTESLPRPAASVINFEVLQDRVRFDVSLPMAEEAGLAISSRLLQVAIRVIGQNP